MKKRLLLVPFLLWSGSVLATDDDAGLYDEGSMGTHEQDTAGEDTISTDSMNEPTVTDDAMNNDDATPAAKKATAGYRNNNGMTAEAMTRDKIIQIQEALNRNGAQLKVDGLLGRGTAKAIREFQKKNALNVNGQADAATLAKLGVTE